ncbi:MAG: type III pantothenate kinase [Proteobacteria bacterium]|nr:type III pantothenate kinase [Pseudomonadota bacterium]MCL2307917.1 type III pantothenate kinase [Pseudomonadota bacterium]
MSHILVIDAGNARLKWALANRYGWSVSGSIANANVGVLALTHWQSIGQPMRVIGVNVAGKAMQHKLEMQMVRWRVRIEWLAPQAEAAGVKNSYADPSRLGADRWAALAAARWRQRRAADANAINMARPCLVVGLGTATTIDALAADGTFLGGLILPGFSLMRNALAANTAGLPLRIAKGVYADFPTSTEDAIFSGAVQAIRGAIAEMRALLAAQHGISASDVMLLAAGGDAPTFLPHLTEPVTIVDNLVLEGVLALAAPEYLPK